MRWHTLFSTVVGIMLTVSVAAAQAFGPSTFDFGSTVVAPGGERIVPFHISIAINREFFMSSPGAERWASFALRFKYDPNKIDLLIGEVRASTLQNSGWWYGLELQPGLWGLAAGAKKTEGGKVVIEVGVGNASNNNTLLSGYFFGIQDPLGSGEIIPFRWVVKTDNFAHGETYLIETAMAGAGQMAKVAPTRTSSIVLAGGFTVPEPASWTALAIGFGGLWTCRRKRKEA